MEVWDSSKTLTAGSRRATPRASSCSPTSGKFAINAGNGIDGASDTDGIDATAQPLGPKFPNGAFVAQDGRNTDPAANDNFKVVPFEAIFPVAP